MSKKITSLDNKDIKHVKINVRVAIPRWEHGRWLWCSRSNGFKVSSSTLVKIEKVSKCFGKARVLNNVSFEIPKGSVLGILGPNGSGKSTLMRIIAGLIKTWDG